MNKFKVIYLISYIFVVCLCFSFLTNLFAKIPCSITGLAHRTCYEEKGRLHAVQYYNSSLGTLVYNNCFNVDDCNPSPCSSTNIINTVIGSEGYCYTIGRGGIYHTFQNVWTIRFFYLLGILSTIIVVYFASKDTKYENTNFKEE